MKRFLCAVLLFIAMTGLCQPTSYTFKYALPTHDLITKIQWADINNDSLLDVVIGYKDQASFKVAAYMNMNPGPWPLQPLVTLPYSEQTDFVLNDVNKDNRLDLVIINEVDFLAHHYINGGNLEFNSGMGWGSPEVLTHDLQFADLNNDGTQEVIWTDGSLLSIINQKDSTLKKVESFQVFDLDLNGFRDLIFSGTDSADHPFTFAWYFGNNFRIIRRLSVADVAGLLAIGDLNHDGLFDIIVSGQDVNGNPTTQLFQNDSTSFSASQSYAIAGQAQVTIADFDDDGLADVSLFGKDLAGNAANMIQFNGYTSNLQTDATHLEFGDYDRDGDLDIAMVTDSLEITNQNPGVSNSGPSLPCQAIGFQVFDKMFFYWPKSSDDHTPVNAITYDLKVYNEDTIFVASDYETERKHRLTVSHGNTGTNNFSLLNLQGNYSFEVQSIDNAFAAQTGLCSGVCTGCGNLEQLDILACNQSSVILTPPAPQAMWFSFKKGFLGTADEFAFEPDESDTVFSFNPASNATCADLRVFNIIANPADTIRLSHTRFDCIGRNITLEVGSDWNNIFWRNNLNTTVINQPVLVHPFQQEIKFTAFASNSYGCKLKEEFLLKEGKPDLHVNGNQFQVMAGNSVQLIATGGSFYQWTPAASLNDDKIGNPIASPDQTTEYTVTAYDSIGCPNQATVLVEVFEEAFIPTLFTPNDDGRNDKLLIFGLTHADGFRFAIYNREGSKLFETTSIQEATLSGWTGAVNGTKQPPGTYYWKVEGNMPKGELLLNGKKSGAVLLVR